ncbi:uncharacterized protein EI90DRAFT_3126264 [Cantharellus anzutake]|uniref:uncharacterized protein n=1 Tax=Cantharellus anzutake TaxID=1750568 RepID=UPI001904C8C4|nr:uncharacterized protein EI90DRAFT_3126264 [Cantharellus anzutake]KAF8328066.1 hypothetical protein EI90DRAFT_3126264 [Cantharellus anzutake]
MQDASAFRVLLFGACVANSNDSLDLHNEANTQGFVYAAALESERSMRSGGSQVFLSGRVQYLMYNGERHLPTVEEWVKDALTRLRCSPALTGTGSPSVGTEMGLITPPALFRYTDTPALVRNINTALRDHRLGRTLPPEVKILDERLVMVPGDMKVVLEKFGPG